MFEFHLPIFPSSYLSYSVITTVLVGMWVISFFNLRFGWVFSGLVVPGYLAPLLLIKPLSVAVILLESIVTYLLVYLISEVAGRRGWYTNFFGRDRFFALLVGSVFIRLVFDGWILPSLNLWSIERFNLSLDYQDSLHSFGLIIVALIANQFWKPKLYVGIFQFFVTVGITYLIVRFVLVEYTNFSLSNIGYLYENIAGSMLSSPKSYIILLVTAFIASRMNLFYGWDFSGILIPSLLALQWYSPGKILISLLEAYIIFGLALLALKAPVFKKMSIEGASKVLFFFNVGFAYKILLSMVIVELFPSLKVSDYFGFGYMLSTLIAVKIYDKISIPMFTYITLRTLLLSIVVATMLGFAFTQIPTTLFDPILQPKSMLSGNTNEMISKSTSKLIDFIDSKKIDLYFPNKKLYRKPTPGELERFERVLTLIDEGIVSNQQHILKYLSALHYDVTMVENRYLVLSPQQNNSGWGMYMIDIDKKNGIVVELPEPFEAGNVVESGVSLFYFSKAKGFAVSGGGVDNTHHQSQDYYSFFHAFHRHYADGNVLQVRALNKMHLKRFYDLTDANKSNSLMFVKGHLPKDLHLGEIAKHLPHLSVSWKNRTETSLQKESTQDGFAEIYLTKMDRIELTAIQLLFARSGGFDTIASVVSIDGLLQAWLLDKKLDIAGKKSGLYIEPTLQELLFMDHSILTPLYSVLRHWEGRSIDYEKMKSQLHSVAVAANVVGYQLTWYHDTLNDKRYIILYETEGIKRRFWGTYVFRIHSGNALMVQVPRPFFESFVFEFGVQIFDRLDANVLLLSGANPMANRDGSADALSFSRKLSLFNLVNQVVFRESEMNTMNALQIRGKSMDNDLDNDNAILAFNTGNMADTPLNSVQKLLETYLKSHLSVQVHQGDEKSAGYDARPFQSDYLSQSHNNTFNVLWLPYSIRYLYRQSLHDDVSVLAFKSVGAEVINQDLSRYLRDYTPFHQECDTREIASALEHYIYTKDISTLEWLVNNRKISMKLVLDAPSRQPYVVIHDAQEKGILIIGKLNAQPPFDTVRFDPKKGELFLDAVRTYSSATASILQVVSQCDD